MERRVDPGLGREVGEGAASAAGPLDAWYVGEGGGAEESGGLMEDQAVVDVSWSCVVEGLVGVG